jgi:type VI secretion system protein ImpM
MPNLALNMAQSSGNGETEGNPKISVAATNLEAGPGFFGKLPSKGDFVTRRLSRDFRDAWQLWLNECLSHSRQVLGDDWLDIYLTSPIWRFALAPGVCGANAVVGVMLPSVDRVGRCYPFATMAAVDGLAAWESSISADASWFETMETHLYDALEETADFDRLDAEIAALGVPRPGFGRFIEQPLPWRDALADLTDIPKGARCCFWGRGSQRIAPSFVAAGHLPGGELYTAMLDGGWAEHGWFDAGPGR